MRHTALILAMLACAKRIDAAGCPDYAVREREVIELLQYKSGNASLPEAYERLVDAWSCTNPSADADDFVRWIGALPSTSTTSSMEAKLDATRVASDRVLVVWARHDVPDGGQAALYARREQRWKLVASVTLHSSPHVVAVIRNRQVVILEENRIPATTAGDTRVLRVDGFTLAQSYFQEDTNNPRLVRKSANEVVIAFERLPRGFTLVDRTSPLRYELVLAADGKVLRASTRSTTPGLETLEQFCQTPQTSGRVVTKSVARRLPSCRDIHVMNVRSRDAKRHDLHVEAPLVCETNSGILEPVTDAVVIVRRVAGAFRIARFERPGCRTVRARGESEAL